MFGNNKNNNNNQAESQNSQEEFKLNLLNSAEIFYDLFINKEFNKNDIDSLAMSLAFLGDVMNVNPEIQKWLDSGATNADRLESLIGVYTNFKEGKYLKAAWDIPGATGAVFQTIPDAIKLAIKLFRGGSAPALAQAA